MAHSGGSAGSAGSKGGCDVSEVIELTLPVRPELLVLVRFTASTLAARAKFSVEEIDDLRLAADEMCLSLTGGDAASSMELRFTCEDDSIEISCTVDMDAVAAPTPDDPKGEWSLQILDVLVDAHGREAVGGRCRAWLRKRRAQVPA
jgi:serine/threonine-protein kinase RsbW